jgi:transcriptional regulator with XRE-family HTH domain
MVTSNTDEQGALGRRIREIRRRENITLRQVADAADVSESFVSQVERGVAHPSMASLTRIASAIGVNVGSLFVGNDSPTRVIRAGQGRRLVHTEGTHEELMLTPPSARTLQVIHAVIGPGEGSGDEPYTHAADEECVIVLDGDLEVWVDGEEHSLAAGDSLMLDPKLPHRYRNAGESPVRSIWVMSPPVF